MRILDFYNNEVEKPDFEKGYLQDSQIFIKHHEAVEAVEEEGYWVTIAEYPNGGIDVDWVIDVPAVEAAEAWDEYEDILRFIEYTAEELAAREAQRQAEQQRTARMEALLKYGVLQEELPELLLRLLPRLWENTEGSEPYGNH